MPKPRPDIVAVGGSPITAVYAALGDHRPRGAVLDLAQAAPDYPPARVVLDRVVNTARSAGGATYTDVPGLLSLRRAFAAEINSSYAGSIGSDSVVITAGCNQAFCVATHVLAEPGSEVIVPLPYYFNHDMWLRLNGINPVYLEPDTGLMPSADAAAALITDRTRAILLVTPGNPSGITVPSDEVTRFAQVARSHGLALILDETYRLFRDDPGPAHTLYTAAWQDTVIGLHSFSKELALPGYRVGAVVAGPALNDEITKLVDCVAVCAPRIGQEAALTGLLDAHRWRTDKVEELASRRAAFRRMMSHRPGGFELVSCGGFFGWVRHPFTGRSTTDVIRELAVGYDVILMPGTAFLPDDRAMIRVSVGNCPVPSLDELSRRLTAFAGSHP